MKRLSTRISALLLALVTALALCPATALAANAKVTARYLANGASTTTVMKKASRVKLGTTPLAITKKGGWIKFTAPAKKQYTFTFTNAKTAGKTSVIGGEFSRITATSFRKVKTVTAEGSRKYFVVADATTARLCKNTRMTYENLKYRYLATRTCKVTVRKGQSIYISLSAAKGSANGRSTACYGTCTLTIS